MNTMVCDDVSHRAAVDGKQQRPEHRPLRNADLEGRTQFVKLGRHQSPVVKLEVGLQPLKQYAVVDCVERRGQVQADLDCDLLD